MHLGRALKPPPSSSWKHQTFYLAESVWGDSEEPVKGPMHHCVGAYMYVYIYILPYCEWPLECPLSFIAHCKR